MTNANLSTSDPAIDEDLSILVMPAPFDRWVGEVRTDSPASEAGQAAARWRSATRKWLVSSGLLLLVLVAVGYFATVAREHFFPPTVVVRGIVCDPQGEALAGARVFLTSDAALETITNRRGEFRLRGVPVGDQSIVVVFKDVGQQYGVPRAENAMADLGTLVYDVPRLDERIKPGRRGGGVPATGSDSTATEGSAGNK